MTQSNWKATPSADYQGPQIILIHGLLAGKHMEKHLLQFLRSAGFEDTSLYSNHHRPHHIANDLMLAATGRANRPVVLIGYSQGGSQVIKVARILQKHGVECDLVISLAAGGMGRLYPMQWGFDMRFIPANVKQYLNYFAANDVLGTDKHYGKNLAIAEGNNTIIENIGYTLDANIDHLNIVRCYPEYRVPVPVKTLFLDRLLDELKQLS